MAKRKPEEPKAGSPEWMATFSDLVTLLMCFFVLLYGMSSIDMEKFYAFAASFGSDAQNITGQAGESLLENLGMGISEMPIIEYKEGEVMDEEFSDRKEEMNQMYDDFMTYFSESNLLEKIEVTKAENYIELTFKDGILFDKGNDRIRDEVYPILESIANLVAMKYYNSEIQITGHTDNIPINSPRFPDNWYLSAGRAINVGNYFINDKGFSPSKIYAGGRGEFEPIEPNDSEENRAKNRRVEMKIYSSFDESGIVEEK